MPAATGMCAEFSEGQRTTGGSRHPWLALYSTECWFPLLTLSPFDTAQVYGLPTIILVKDGQKVAGSHHEGAITQVRFV